MLVAPSFAGELLGAAAFLAFLVRTPLKLVGVDLARRRWLNRTRLAAAIAGVELVAIAAVAAVVTALSGWSWWVVVVVAAPLVVIELWFDVHSRGRRLVPVMCGAIAVSGGAAAIAVVSGQGAALAVALWLVLGARAIGAIPFVRSQIARLRHSDADVHIPDLAQVAAILVGAAAVATDSAMRLGFVTLVGLSALQIFWLRRPPVPAKALGLRQMAMGLALVLATAAGAALM
jgi:hypothetical protein